MLSQLLFCVFIGNVLAKSQEHVTFKNVVAQGYSMFTHKFNVTIQSSNSLKDNLPKQVFDKIEIINGNIPVLYEKSISDIDDLDELILENDDIREIRPGSFEGVPQLRQLVIRGNQKLKQIKEGVFNNLNVATLDLSKNAIDNIASGAFDDMPELLNINLADNQLQTWDKHWFANTPLLTRISMQNNLISELPAGAFKNLQGEKQFGTLSLKINIVLSHNKISKISKDAFKDLNEINNLWLDNNEIEVLDENLLSAISVRDFRIDANKLTCLSGEYAKIFVADTTHIDGNPWECECLKNIQLWATEQKKDVVMYYAKMTCDVERIQQKIKNLNNLLKNIRDRESSETAATPETFDLKPEK